MASTVIHADSSRWSLSGDVRLTTRAAIARWCPPAAGTENDPILLTHNATGERALVNLRFQGAAFIAYGAIIGDLEGRIIRGFDGGVRGDALPAEDVAAAESHSAAGDAACGFVLASRNNFKTDEVQRFEISPAGDVEFAIFNAELFQQPIQTTPAGGGVSTTPTSASGTSNKIPSTTSSETSAAASSIGTINPPASSSTPIAAIIIPIVVGLLMLLALVAFLLFRRRRRRHTIPPDFTVDSFDSVEPLNHMSLAPTTASAISVYRTGKPALSDSDDTRPYTITSLPSTTSDPHARTDEKFRLLHVTDPKGWQGQGSGSTSPGLSTPGMGTVDLDAPPSGSTARGEDVVQMQALSEAMQRAGFSPAALLESLNRVHERADDEGAALETTTEARTRPPQYRE